jgi:hypothetical protein
MFRLIVFALYVTICLLWFRQVLVYTGLILAILFFIRLPILLYRRKRRKSISLFPVYIEKVGLLSLCRLLSERLIKARPKQRLDRLD